MPQKLSSNEYLWTQKQIQCREDAVFALWKVFHSYTLISVYRTKTQFSYCPLWTPSYPSILGNYSQLPDSTGGHESAFAMCHSYLWFANWNLCRAIFLRMYQGVCHFWMLYVGYRTNIQVWWSHRSKHKHIAAGADGHCVRLNSVAMRGNCGPSCMYYPLSRGWIPFWSVFLHEHYKVYWPCAIFSASHTIDQFLQQHCDST